VAGKVSGDQGSLCEWEEDLTCVSVRSWASMSEGYLAFAAARSLCSHPLILRQSEGSWLNARYLEWPLLRHGLAIQCQRKPYLAGSTLEYHVKSIFSISSPSVENQSCYGLLLLWSTIVSALGVGILRNSDVPSVRPHLRDSFGLIPFHSVHAVEGQDRKLKILYWMLFIFRQNGNLNCIEAYNLAVAEVG
jgi:hypothetical protein